MAKKIVTIGGGNGSPVINEALLRTGKVDFINTISAVFDTGGATGRRRADSRGQEIAFSDPMRNLLSLVNPHLHGKEQYKALVELLTSRFWGRVLGQEIFAHFHKEGDGFDNVQAQLTKLTKVSFMGKVLPSTADSTNIKFSTKSGRIHTGEDQLDTHHMSEDTVLDMWLEKKVFAYPEAKKAIQEADLIILSCGSLYGSVLCNVLPLGMKKAFKETRAKIYMVTNLVSTRSETHDFKPLDFVKLIKKYTGIKPTGLIVPEISRKEFEAKFKDVALIYKLDYSYFLGWEKDELKKAQKEGIQILTHSGTSVVETKANEKIVRHDPEKLSKTLKKLL